MQEAGCDIFPERDAYSYIKGLSMKHSITEKHLQKCMGLLCRAYSFSWSRWNATRISREIVLQFKELHGCVAKERSNVTLLVTPLQTLAIQCTEVSSDFCNTPIDGDLKVDSIEELKKKKKTFIFLTERFYSHDSFMRICINWFFTTLELKVVF